MSKATVRVGLKRNYSSTFAPTQPYVSQKSQKINYELPTRQRQDIEELSAIEDALVAIESAPLDVHTDLSSIRNDFIRRLDLLEKRHQEERLKHVTELRDELFNKYVQLTTYMSNWGIDEPHRCTKCYKSILEVRSPVLRDSFNFFYVCGISLTLSALF